jgi:hypothetical protein
MSAYESGYSAGQDAHFSNPNLDIRQVVQAAHSWAANQGYTDQDGYEAVEGFIDGYEDADQDLSDTSPCES